MLNRAEIIIKLAKVFNKQTQEVGDLWIMGEKSFLDENSNDLMQEQHWGIMYVRVYVCAEDKKKCECELSLHTEHCLRRKAKYSEPLIGNMCRSVWANSGYYDFVEW